MIKRISLGEYKFELKGRRKIKEEKGRELGKSCTTKTKKLEAEKEGQFQGVSFNLYPTDLEQLSSYGCSTPSTLMSSGMGATDPKLVKG